MSIFGFRSMGGGRRSLLLMIWLCGWAVGRAQEPAGTVSGLPEELLPGLAPILKTALERSHDVIRRSIDVRWAEGSVYMGRSVRLPSAQLSAQYEMNYQSTIGGAGASSTNSGFYYDFRAAQPLYAWGALKATEERERIALQIAEKQFAEGYRTLAILLRAQYLALIGQKSEIVATREKLRLDRESLERSRAALRAETVAEVAVAGEELAVKESELQLDRAVMEFDAARRSFIRLSGIGELPEDAIPATVARPDTVRAVGSALLQRFLHVGREQTFQAQVLALGVEREQRSYVIASRRLYPKFSLFAGYNQRSETQADINRINQVAISSRYFGIRTDWSIFDGFATTGEKIRALAGKRSYERQLQSHLEESSEQVSLQWARVGLAARTLELAENGLAGAKAMVEYVEKELAAGRATPPDRDRAKQAVLVAEARALRVRADYLMTWTTFVSLVGADPVINNLPARYVR